MIIQDQMNAIIRQTAGVRDAANTLRELNIETFGSGEKIANTPPPRPVDPIVGNLLAATSDLELAVEELHREVSRLKEPGLGSATPVAYR